VFTARYALSPYIKQICFVIKGLNKWNDVHNTFKELCDRWCFSADSNLDMCTYMLNSHNKNVYGKITINVVDKCFECLAAAE
jgi:hypothetical protein